jgi:tRNA(Ile)-lysidine synthase
VQLGQSEDAEPSDLGRTVEAILDRRLHPGSARPVAVALSGGGDSLALLLVSAVWANRVGRDLLVLTVDHGLQAQSAGWVRACAATAGRLGLPFHALRWEGEKPATGLPAAARAARHRLLADAARATGARVILLGHTADDVLEARQMRADGASTPEPREWSPSPAWPQGRGLFLLRPLLGMRRSSIRDWLSSRAEHWIEDPANADLSYARPRARRAIAAGAASPAPAPRPATDALALACEADIGGGFTLARAKLRQADPMAAAAFVAAASLCAAGTDRPPPSERVRRLAERLASDQSLAASLAGARIEADDTAVRFMREPGEAARGGLKPLRLCAGETEIWDGRFEVTADRPAQVRASSGLVRKLEPAAQVALQPLPPRARATLPVLVDEDGGLSLATLRPITHQRLLAACDVVKREPA